MKITYKKVYNPEEGDPVYFYIRGGSHRMDTTLGRRYLEDFYSDGTEMIDVFEIYGGQDSIHDNVWTEDLLWDKEKGMWFVCRNMS